MTQAKIRELIETALGFVEFTPPVSVAFCTAVRDELRKVLPNAVLECFWRPEQFNVLVIDGATRVEYLLPLV